MQENNLIAISSLNQERQSDVLQFLGSDFKETLKNLSSGDRRRLILSMLYSHYPWESSQISLSEHVRINSQVRNKSPQDQFYRDIIMMRDAILYPGYDLHNGANYYGSLASSVLKKIQFMLRHYGPMYRRGDQWNRFSDAKEIPLASILLHSGRLLIQLPKISKGRNLGEEFFQKFLGMSSDNRRMAATHGIEICSDPVDIGNGVKKFLSEYKPKAIGPIFGHYGINLALGGFGNTHFLSQSEIDNRGGNGHLYLYHLPATQDTPGGLLIGIEQSAPRDFAPEIGSIFYGVPDNSGGVHTIRGGSNTFTASSGTPWASKNKDKKFENIKEFSELDKCGPDKYYDAMFMNLNEADLAEIFSLYKEEKFDISWLAEPPISSVGKRSGSNARLDHRNEGFFSKKKEAPSSKFDTFAGYLMSYIFP